MNKLFCLSPTSFLPRYATDYTQTIVYKIFKTNNIRANPFFFLIDYELLRPLNAQRPGNYFYMRIIIIQGRFKMIHPISDISSKSRIRSLRRTTNSSQPSERFLKFFFRLEREIRPSVSRE